jgi:hypothetical protein
MSLLLLLNLLFLDRSALAFCYSIHLKFMIITVACTCTETPGAPRGPLIAKNEGRDSVTLSWQPPLDDGGSPITGYIIDKLDVQRGGWQRAARVASGQKTYTLQGLNVGHDYNFRVYAENKAGVGAPLDLKTPIKAKSAFSEYRDNEFLMRQIERLGKSTVWLK